VIVRSGPDLHLIPDDGWPHAPTTECGCGPQPAAGHSARRTFRHAVLPPVGQ
jgi:hypothetical protein